MGNCLDCHLGLLDDLRSVLQAREHQPENPSRLTLACRQGFLDETHARFEAGLTQEDIDETPSRMLTRLLKDEWGIVDAWGVENCVQAWHTHRAWPDVLAALPLLKQEFDVYASQTLLTAIDWPDSSSIVLADDTSRPQLDTTRGAGLEFSLLLSSELLGMTRPDPAIYRRAIALLKCHPEECLLVAAHAYDFRAAKGSVSSAPQVVRFRLKSGLLFTHCSGMRTAHIRRWTEDRNEDLERVQAENGFFIDGVNESARGGGGLGALAQLLGVEIPGTS